MNVLQNLVELYNHLPLDSTYRTVAKGILENLDKVQNATIYDIADLTNSSRTTVWRMVQKMGYENFSDFRHALSTAVSKYTYYNRMITPEISFYAEKTLAEVNRQLAEGAKIMDRCLNPELLEELAKQLHKASKVHFYLPFQLTFVHALQQNLAMSGKETAYLRLFPDMLDAAENLDENSIAIISTIEFSETLDMKPLFMKLRKKGTVIWLAGNGTTQYRRYAEQMLLDEEDSAFAWIMSLEGLLLSLSEYYRATYIDEQDDPENW